MEIEESAPPERRLFVVNSGLDTRSHGFFAYNRPSNLSITMLFTPAE